MKPAGEHHSITFLPDRLNREPVIFRGLTNPEMFQLAKLGAMVWLPVCFFVAWLCNATIMGLGAGVAMTLLTVVVGGTLMQRVKRGKPEGYHVRRLQIWFQDKGIGSSVFMRYSGRWASRRETPFFKEVSQ